MVIIRVRRRRLMAKVAVTLGFSMVAMSTMWLVWAQVAGARTIYCDQFADSRQPVLLVHGYDSGPATWGPAARDQLARDGRATCIDVFNYATWSTNWVTDPHIGPALAQRIATLAAASTAGGGTGKVIIVAHSMGGLAVRCAVNPGCGGDGNLTSSVADVITFDTPNTGSWLRANHDADGPVGVLASVLSGACYASFNATDPMCEQIRALGTSAATKAFTPGSAQLHRLPPIPRGLPVFAVAGRVEITTSVFGWKTIGLGDAGDLVVTEHSAQAEAARYGQLGGTKTINCGTANLARHLHGSSCSHLTETNDTKFLAAAVRQIALAEHAGARPARAGLHDARGKS